MITVTEYKGSIRNLKPLCAELGVREASSRTLTEREIIRCAYEKWGTSMGNHIYGGFCAALWDDENKSLFCVRDPLGIESFYYYLTARGELLYGTSIRPLMSQPGFVKTLNMRMLPIYLKLTYPAGEETFFEGVMRLMPGHFLVFRDGEIQTGAYRIPRFEPDNDRTSEQWAQDIHSLMLQIFSEIKTDEEAVSFLSGGVDSSYVLALSDAKGAFTAGYDIAEFDESATAREAASFLSRNIETRQVDFDEFFDLVPSVMHDMEQPLADASAIVFAVSCKTAAQQVSVCYSGEGGDEFFGGYHAYTHKNKIELAKAGGYLGCQDVIDDEGLLALLKDGPEETDFTFLTKEIRENNANQNALTQMMAIDIGLWLEGDIYLNIARMSEAAGLKVHMPISDVRMLQLAEKIPSRHKVSETDGKIVFRMAAENVLPKQIAQREKRGFPVPMRTWLKEDRGREKLLSVLYSETADRFFNRAELDRLLDNYYSGRKNRWQLLWNIYTFLVWYREYFG